MIVGGDARIQPVPGRFHGRPTLRLEGAAAWVEVLADGGPRIVGLGLPGRDNLLAETPDEGWETRHGRYELVGGHRLWFAPEDPRVVAVPDHGGLTVERLPDGLRLAGATEPDTGLVRTIDVRLDAALPAIDVRHELRNGGQEPLELAPWSITQLPLDGRVLVPQRPPVAGHAVRPNRTLVLWPYTSWEDPRIRIGDTLLTVDADAGSELKIGTFDEAGWVAYAREGVALVRRFEPAVGELHADLGCNVETYCGPGYLELEVLGPLRLVEPGGVTELHERWELLTLPDPAESPTALATRIATSPDGRGAIATRRPA